MASPSLRGVPSNIDCFGAFSLFVKEMRFQIAQIGLYFQRKLFVRNRINKEEVYEIHHFTDIGFVLIRYAG